MFALNLHRFLLRFALAGVNIFAWIFVFQYFYLVEPDIAHALTRTVLLYALSQVITCLLIPYAARALRGGTRPMLVMGILAASSGFVVLGATFAGNWDVAYAPAGIAVFAIALGVYRALYFVPYEVQALAHHKRSRTSIFAELCIALVPFVVGLFIVTYEFGPVWVLYIGAATVALSALPLLYLRDIHEGFSWGYRETFAHFLLPVNHPVVNEAFFEGISGAALLLFWPIGIFLIAEWSYGMLGIVLSLTFIIAILGRGIVRKLLRRASMQKSRLLNVLLAISPWLFRIVVGTPLGVIFTDSYFFTTTPRRTGVDALTFEQASDGGSYIDEYTTLKEVALALGRIFICVVGAAVAVLVSFPVALVVVFLIAAAASTAVALRPR